MAKKDDRNAAFFAEMKQNEQARILENSNLEKQKLMQMSTKQRAECAEEQQRGKEYERRREQELQALVRQSNKYAQRRGRGRGRGRRSGSGRQKGTDARFSDLSGTHATETVAIDSDEGFERIRRESFSRSRGYSQLAKKDERDAADVTDDRARVRHEVPAREAARALHL